MHYSSWDMHCHLGWFEDPVRTARDAAAGGAGLFAVTVTPREYQDVAGLFQAEKYVRLGAGLHPWWVRDAADADSLLDLLPETRFVGEIGLDASARHVSTWDAQLAAFERICATCAQTSDAAAPKVLSIHAVRSAGAVLDVLERTGAATSCRCVLHWFSGSSEELWRAVELGCSFSLGERALGTRRGREYARILPAERLLSETDLPESPNAPGGASAVLASLNRVVTSVAVVRDASPEEVRRLFAINAAALLDV